MESGGKPRALQKRFALIDPLKKSARFWRYRIGAQIFFWMEGS
jgi:hypothetical protein